MPQTIEAREDVKQYRVMEVAAPGFGNQESSISHRKSRENGSLTPEIEAYMEELITSGECMTKADVDDDGCLDGRPAEFVTFINDAGEQESKPVDYSDGKRHARQKLAGGGYITGLAMKRATEPPHGNIDEDLAIVVDDLSEQGVHCGAHTGPHGQHGDCDCGANYKIEQILRNGVLYAKDEQYGKGISGQVQGLLAFAGLPFSQNIMDETFTGWAATVNNPSYFAGSTSVGRLNVIMNRLQAAQSRIGAQQPLAVSKHLKGSHKEVAKVINYVDGDTFDQNLYLEKMHARFPHIKLEELPQVFAVDVPRIALIAKAKAANYPIEQRDRIEQIALYAGIAYQSATEATLTDGTMRTFLVANA